MTLFRSESISRLCRRVGPAPFNLARRAPKILYVFRKSRVARALQLSLMPVWSEAAPPAPLRGHFLFCRGPLLPLP